MSNMRDLLDLINEMSEEGTVELHDSFDFELGEDILIETGVVDITEDGIIVEGDDETIKLLSEHGLILNEKMIMGLPGDQGSKTMGEDASMSIDDLATISDEALDKAYGYGRSSPGNSFGWQANLKSAEFAKKMIDAGIEDIEKISDAIHKGWNVTAQAFVQKPEQFDDTEKLKAAGKLEAKLQQRAELMKKNYAQLPEEEKEKDRVVARALLKAIKGISEGPADEPVEPDMDADDKRWDDIEEAKYQGREVPLGKPMAGDVKKSKVYVRKPDGKVVKVNFGDKKMRIKKSNPARRKSFRARHNCKNPGPRWKARYWSCRAW